MSKKVTMQQIADHLGVSKFVISKALSGKSGVNEQTKERVIQAASQLGYFTQKNAYVKSMLKTDQLPEINGANKQSVIVLMPNIRFQTKDSLYWGRIVDGIAARLERDGLGMVIISEQSVDHFLHLLNPSGILGLIGVGEISTSLLLEVHRIGLPMVLVDHEDPLIPTDTVFVNNYDSINRLAKHLMGTGHRQLHFIGDIQFSRSFYDRWTGFRSALEEQGSILGVHDQIFLSLNGIESEYFQEQIRNWAAKRKKAGNLPTALLCANDFIAICAVRALQELGISVPEQVSVTGFDNIEVADQLKPKLTTVHVPKETLGRRAVDKLLERIANRQEPVEKLLIAGEILYRESTVASARE
ncbi:MAG: LacI family DNA-binding transcriptional regulator [Candidatus Pristimantibacillus sp.]